MSDNVNRPNPNRDRLIKMYPQRPLFIPGPGFPISVAVRDQQVIADTTGLTRWIAYVDGEDQPQIIEITPDPVKRALYRGRLDQ